MTNSDEMCKCGRSIWAHGPNGRREDGSVCSFWGRTLPAYAPTNIAARHPSGTKHTPGPWCLRGSQIRQETIELGVNGYPISGRHIATYQISEADGRLIAAAPELLALLEEIITHVATYPDQHERAKALVARIKGASR